MKRALFLLLAITTISTGVFAQTRLYKEGTVVRMRMAECSLPQNRWMVAFAGGMPAQTTEQCTEYTLVSDRVVYTVVARSSGQLIPLAENVQFRMKKNELLVKLDDDPKESRFFVKEMTLRNEWESRQAERQRLSRAAHAQALELSPGD